jgi:hypothetical protein
MVRPRWILMRRPACWGAGRAQLFAAWAALGPAILFSILGPLTRECRAALVINEVLYDPAGADAGREFVEIANTGPFAAPLEELILEAGNGGRADDWEEVWRGRSDAWIEPGGYYRIGLDGPGNGESVEISLQNGPDGVRLRKQGFELDRVGWGEHVHPEYYEGRPTPLTRAGQSISRRIDGADTGDNAADFEPAAPTPGRPNRPTSDWAIRIGSPAPELPRPGGSLIVLLTIVNRGVESRTPPPVDVLDRRQSVQVGWNVVVPPQGSAVQPLMLEAPADTGRTVWRARLLASDQVPENDCDSLVLRVGAGRVRITEILAAPAQGECEWIEISAAGSEGLTLSGYALDVRGHRVDLVPRVPDATNTLGLIVEDSTLMLTRHPELSPATIWSHGGAWPRLRNGDRSGGVSDTLRLVGPDGLLADLALPGAAPAPGVSLERLGIDLPEGPAAWIPCGDPDRSTPGRIGPGAVPVPAGDGFTVHPPVVHPGSSTCLFEGTVGSVPGEVRLDLFDLEGAQVRCLLRDLWVVGKLVATWDGRDEAQQEVEPGVYVAVLEVNRKGSRVERRRVAVAVAPGTAR